MTSNGVFVKRYFIMNVYYCLIIVLIHEVI